MPRVRPATSALAATLALTLPVSGNFTLYAQMHRVQKSEPVTRAVAVYEYAGDLKKPTAARLIPVSLFIGGHYEDAGSYLARPIPFALDTGNIYELQEGGKPLGTLDLAYAKNLRGSSAEVTVPYDEAWFGYGRFTPAKPPAADTPKAGARHTQHAYAVHDDGKPHFGDKSAPRDSRDTTDVDPGADRAEKVSLPDDRDPSTPNPDRPTLRRRPEDTTGGPKQKKQKVTASVSETPTDPGKDPDRPTIKRKEAASSPDDGIPPDPAEVNSSRSVHGEAGTVSVSANAKENGVLSDGARPELRRNAAATASSPAKTQASSLPDLQKVPVPGTPGALSPDLHFAVAVSDPKDRPQHDFSTPFANEAEKTAAMGEMRTLALTVLKNPTLATDALAFAPVTAPTRTVTPASPIRRQTPVHGTSRRTATTAAKASAPALTDVLEDEQLAAFTLSYSGPLTYVYTARTASTPTRYVTVVAQRNLDGKLDIGLRSVTDGLHLDRIPRYRLVDAVDADGSNRANLLFELLNGSSRQFALYRFLGPRPDQIFLTASVM